MGDLSTVFDAIKAKAPKYDALSGYYSGDQPTVYLTKRMREVFRPLDITFVENWCHVVITACDDRINLANVGSVEVSVKKVLAEAWERNQLDNEASDIHTDAQVLGECYAIAWPGEDMKAEVFYNDPRMVHVVYSGSNPRKIAYAGKLWRGDDGLAKLTMYYPDRLEYYTSSAKYENVSNANAFTPDETAGPEGKIPNIYGKVPVFHFRINRRCVSDLKDVLSLQNGVNKLLADMMVAAEYGAYNQRWVISEGDTEGLKNAPGEVWDLPAGDGTGQPTSVGQFASTDLKNYLDAIDRLSMSIGVITSTPKHYFFGQNGDPSGEALIALESPLNKKAQDRIDRFKPVWKDLALFICQIEGMTADPEKIQIDFLRPETVQPKTQADIIKVMVDSTIPLETALTRAGWSTEEIEAMKKLKEEADAKAEESLANALLKSQQDMKTKPMPGAIPQQGAVVPPNGQKSVEKVTDAG